MDATFLLSQAANLGIVIYIKEHEKEKKNVIETFKKLLKFEFTPIEASIALPPCLRISIPIFVASGCPVLTAPI